MHRSFPWPFCAMLFVCNLVSGCEDTPPGVTDPRDMGALGDASDLGPSDATLDAIFDAAPDVTPDITPDVSEDLPDTPRDMSAGTEIPGDPMRLATDALPDLDLEPHPDDAWLEDTGALVSRTWLTVSVTDEATLGGVNDLLRQLQARVVGSSSWTGRLTLAVPPDSTGEAVMNAVRIARSSPIIEAAAVEFQGSELRSPPSHERVALKSLDDCLGAPPEDAPNHLSWDHETEYANWGLKFMRAPFAWNLLGRIERLGQLPRVHVLDVGFLASQTDVSMTRAQTFDRGKNLEYTVVSVNGTDAREADDHGTSVVSSLAATYDDQGIEGVFPYTTATALDVQVSVRDKGFSGQLTQVEDILRRTSARIINLSQGFTYLNGNKIKFPDSGKILGFGNTWGEEMAEYGKIFLAMERRLVARGRADWLVFCAAGNDGLVDEITIGSKDVLAQDAWREAFRGRLPYHYPARFSSGCNWAADEIAPDRRFISVSALAYLGDDLARLSQVGGTLSAPGMCVATAGYLQVQNEDDDGIVLERLRFRSDKGTSFATPMVAGAAAVLWSLAPELTPADIRSLLFDGAKTMARVDLYGSILKLDEVLGGNSIAVELADLDDGTQDGNMRMIPPLMTTPQPGVLHATGHRGDGCVDIKDLRAMRDAVIDARSTDTATALDGPADHPKRDYNLDGYIAYTGSMNRPDGVAGSERLWSRYDLDGDLDVDEDDFRLVASQYGTCRSDVVMDPQTDALSAAGAAQYLNSVDVWVDVPDDRPSTLSASDGVFRSLDPLSRPEDLVNGHAVITVRLPCQRLTVCLGYEDGGVPKRACKVLETSTWAAGNDRVESFMGSITRRPLTFFSDQGARAVNQQGSVYVQQNPQATQFVGHPMATNDSRVFFPSPGGDRIAYWGCKGDPDGFGERFDCLVFQDALSGATTRARLPYTRWEPNGQRSRWAESGDALAIHITSTSTHPIIMDTPRILMANESMTRDLTTDMYIESGRPMALSPRQDHIYFSGWPAADPQQQGLHRAAVSTFTTNDAQCVLPGVLAGEKLGGDSSRLSEGDLAVSWNGDLLYREGLIGPTTLSLMRSDGSAFVRVAADPAHHVAWAPDARGFAYSGTDSTIWHVRYPAGGFPADSAALVKTQISGAMQGALAYSPDGRYLLVHQFEPFPMTGNEVHVYDLTTPAAPPKTFAHDRTLGDPVWAADGSGVILVQHFVDPCGSQMVSHSDIVRVNVPSFTTERLSQALTDPAAAFADCPAPPTQESAPAWGPRAGINAGF